jgi:hypothetical protein
MIIERNWEFLFPILLEEMPLCFMNDPYNKNTIYHNSFITNVFVSCKSVTFTVAWHMLSGIRRVTRPVYKNLMPPVRHHGKKTRTRTCERRRIFVLEMKSKLRIENLRNDIKSKFFVLLLHRYRRHSVHFYMYWHTGVLFSKCAHAVSAASSSSSGVSLPFCRGSFTAFLKPTVSDHTSLSCDVFSCRSRCVGRHELRTVAVSCVQGGTFCVCYLQ